MKELPGGDPSTDTRKGFSTIDFLADGKVQADLDAGTLVFVCALRHRQEYEAGVYLPATREFLRMMILLRKVHKWSFRVVFDGVPPPEKRYEHERRNQQDGLRITSLFEAHCIHVCKRMNIPYIVAASEADVQVCKHLDYNGVAITRDSDILAYGNLRVLLIDSYGKEEYRFIDMRTPLTEDVIEKYPLYYHYTRHGPRVLYFWAAVMGCDFTKQANGISHVGRSRIMAALHSLRHLTHATNEQFAEALWNNLTTGYQHKHSIMSILTEINRIQKFFTRDATYYDDACHVKNLAGQVVELPCRRNHQHMKGENHPRTKEPYSTAESEALQMLAPHNLLHNSCADRTKIRGLSFPQGKSSVKELKVDELKAMIIARGGSVTDKEGNAMRKEALSRMVEAYLSMENQNTKHTVFFDRSRDKNGIFSSVDISKRTSVPDSIRALLRIDTFEPALKSFFTDILRLFEQDRFTDDWNTIVLEAPEVTEKMIHNAFIHVGLSENQKNIVSGLKSVMELDKVVYHAIAHSEDGSSLYVLSKQRASMLKNQQTRKDTGYGERPEAKEYLVMAQLMVEPTTDPSHGHTLGLCTRVQRSYCAECKAGFGMCYHRAGLLWMQMLHWGEGRPTEKPATSDYCSWIPGSRTQRTCSTIQPAYAAVREKLPTSNAMAAAKTKRSQKKAMWEGLPATYDIYGGNERKRATLDDPEYLSKARIEKLFKCLRLNNTVNEKKRGLETSVDMDIFGDNEEEE